MKKIKPYLYCLLIAFLFLMICSKNSFLYEINDWVDANCFMTLGKGMMNGIIPYLDLFEQKGPILYLIYGIGSLFSSTNFLGVFFIEVLFFSVFLYYTYKIITLFYEEKKAYIIIPLYTLVIVTLKSFSHGGSAEEFTLPLIMISLYYLVKYLKDKDQILIPKYQVFVAGIIAGIILWIKYTLLGFSFAFMMCLFFILIYNKKYKEAFLNCLIFLLGMIVITIPVMLYFYFNNSLKELIDIYLLVNINAYPSETSIIIKLIETIKLIILNIFGNPLMFVFIVLGFILLFKNKKWGKKGANVILLTCLIFTGLFIYIGGTNFHYYSLPLSVFMLVGLMMLFKLIKIDKFSILFIILPLISAYYTSQNVEMMKLDKNDYAQYKFAEIIKKDKNKTLLNYGFLDGGFYLTTNTLPNIYYYQKNNIPYKNYPIMENEQNRYINEKKTNFIVAKDHKRFNKKIFEKSYKLVATHQQKYQQKDVKYLLYKLK